MNQSQILRAIRLAIGLQTDGGSVERAEIRIGVDMNMPRPSHYARVYIGDVLTAGSQGDSYDSALDQLVTNLQSTAEGRLAYLADVVARAKEAP